MYLLLSENACDCHPCAIFVIQAKARISASEIPGQARNDKAIRAVNVCGDCHRRDSVLCIDMTMNAWSFRGAKTPNLFAAGE